MPNTVGNTNRIRYNEKKENKLKKPSFNSLLLIATLLLAAQFIIGCSSEEELKWTAINVNTSVQGDAHLISKGDKHFLIDGGAYSVSNQSLLPYLKDNNIKVIDKAFISHPHFDHYGGIWAILENGIKINSIYMNMPNKERMDREWWGGKYADLVTIKNSAGKYGYKFYSISKGDKFYLDKDSYLEILYTHDGISPPVGATDINDMSFIGMLHDKGNKFLFTGDLNKKLSRWLVKNAKNLKADVLKFPHHGAESFAVNMFLDKVDAKVVIIPAPEHLYVSKRSKRTRDYVRDNNITAYVNGIDGHITVISKDGGFSIYTQNGKQHLYPKHGQTHIK